MTNNIVKQGELKEELFEEYRKKPVVVKAYQTEEELEIETLEGVMRADVGDYIILGVKGEPYPCKPDIFYETYESATKEPETIEDWFTLWNRYVYELTEKERELINIKESYSQLEDNILAKAKKIKDDPEDGRDIIKEKYGGNNDKTRKKYVEESLKPEKDKQHDLELRINFLKRRINYIQSLMSMQQTLLEYGGNQI